MIYGAFVFCSSPLCVLLQTLKLRKKYWKDNHPLYWDNQSYKTGENSGMWPLSLADSLPLSPALSPSFSRLSFSVYPSYLWGKLLEVSFSPPYLSSILRILLVVNLKFSSKCCSPELLLPLRNQSIVLKVLIFTSTPFSPCILFLNIKKVNVINTFLIDLFNNLPNFSKMWETLQTAPCAD